MNTKDIYVEWSGPYTYSEIIHKSSKDGFAVKPTDFGLYQIYGKHPLYGDGVLLYIGKTEQEFYKRLQGRGVITDNIDSDNVQIYLGRTYYDGTFGNVNISEDISRAESLLIHYHKPGHNSSNINSLKYADEDIRIFNIGSYRSLHGEVSTNGFIKEQKIFSIIDDIANQTYINKNKYDEEDGYGYFLDKNEKIWFGVDYELWNGETTLVLITDEKLDKTFKESIFSEDEEKIFYKSINGKEEDIVKTICEYKNKSLK